jgi:hypothetical protein
MELLKRGATINPKSRGIRAEIKDVKTTNLKSSDKQEDESSHHPPHNPDLAPSESHDYSPLKDTL